MKSTISLAAYVAVVVFVFAAVFLGTRMWNAATVRVSTHDPEPGVRCAVATSSDGVAISCWKTEQPQ